MLFKKSYDDLVKEACKEWDINNNKLNAHTMAGASGAVKSLGEAVEKVMNETLREITDDPSFQEGEKPISKGTVYAFCKLFKEELEAKLEKL